MRSMSPNSRARSSMEEMLYSLRRKEENERPKDIPPALPARPKPASRNRLPSPKRTRRGTFNPGESESSESSSNFKGKNENTKDRVKEWENVEDIDYAKLGRSPLDMHPRFRESEWDENAGYFVEKIGALEDVRNQVLQGTLVIQKYFRGHCSRRCFHELKGGVVTLQSFIRAEISRREYCALLKIKQIARKRLVSVVRIQSVVRGWLCKRKVSYVRNSKMPHIAIKRPGWKIPDFKDMPPERLPSVIEELQRKVIMAETILGQKERENAALREQIRQFEVQWSEYGAKIKYLEEEWQKHTASLQMSLAAVEKSLGVDDNVGQPASVDGSPSPRYYDCDDMSMRTQTPREGTHVEFVYEVIDVGAGQLTGDDLNMVIPLVMEFEQRKKKFDDQARAIVDVTSEHSPAINPEEELRSLKCRFRSWRKDYRVWLREVKAKVHRLGQDEAERNRLIWQGKEEQNILAFLYFLDDLAVKPKPLIPFLNVLILFWVSGRID